MLCLFRWLCNVNEFVCICMHYSLILFSSVWIYYKFLVLLRFLSYSFCLLPCWWCTPKLCYMVASYKVSHISVYHVLIPIFNCLQLIHPDLVLVAPLRGCRQLFTVKFIGVWLVVMQSSLSSHATCQKLASSLSWMEGTCLLSFPLSLFDVIL